MLKMEEGSFVLLWHEEDKGHFSAFSKLTCLIHSCLFFKDSELLVSRYANDIFFYSCNSSNANESGLVHTFIICH